MGIVPKQSELPWFHFQKVQNEAKFLVLVGFCQLDTKLGTPG